jgi:murein DD-endopeptidase MepM/ murein hydrolase activator NlpD
MLWNLPIAARPLTAIGTTVLMMALLAACGGRVGQPAPVVDRTGIFYTSPARATPPVTPAPRTQVRQAPLAPPIAAFPKRTARATSQKSAVRATIPRRAARKISPPTQPGTIIAAGTLTTRPEGRVTVRSSETLYAIARREMVPIRSLIDTNQLQPPYTLQKGRQLRVPAMRVYVVASGDTAYAIGRRHDVSIHQIIRENGLKPPSYGLFAGQRLILPWRGAALPPKATPQAVKQRPGSGNLPRRATTVEARLPQRPELRATVPPRLPRVELRDPSAPPPKRAGRKFQWPIRGKVMSSFGAKGGGLYNDGINIAAKPGQIVRAAENGIVAYAGNELRGYGNLLLVRHAGGWISAYAHNGTLMVRRGQVIKRGQPIARVGKSGAVAQPQLHFELRRGRKAVNPRRYLG